MHPQDPSFQALPGISPRPRHRSGTRTLLHLRRAFLGLKLDITVLGLRLAEIEASDAFEEAEEAIRTLEQLFDDGSNDPGGQPPPDVAPAFHEQHLLNREAQYRASLN